MRFRLAGVLVASLGLAVVSGQALAQEKKGHCEKKGKDGKITDIDATDKEDCKKKGGKWNKGEGGHDHHD